MAPKRSRALRNKVQKRPAMQEQNQVMQIEIQDLSRINPHASSLEEASGPSTAAKQVHSKRKPARTSAPECEEAGEQSQRKMFTDIMQQAKTTADVINIMSQPRTVHERTVYAFSTFLREEMLQIPECEWLSYSSEAFAVARAHRSPQPSLMRHMPFMGHQQMGMMAPHHAHRAMMGPRHMAYPWMASAPNIRAGSSTPHQAHPASDMVTRDLRATLIPACRERLLSSHQVTRFSIPFLYAITSGFDICPTTVVSSANL
ncbi:uncharacterized protein LOC116981736 [Amblyraja radiata]|uniref:uncharacterized protein LOC116981736 n=1 Tax=Amblyraja radiata TaxID=386614 RepID=UPI0014027984|nr:uncharacterized protein LOC116981736 [Amblyraja radiata]